MSHHRRHLGSDLGALILAGAVLLSPALAAAGGSRPDGSPEEQARERAPLIGVKIYDPVPDTQALLREWAKLGVDTVFLSTTLAESGTFVPVARRAGLRTLVITPVFYNPGYLAAHPEAYAIDGRGERARQDWVEFVCPSREDYRQQRTREALALLEKHHPDGLSLDFIRHFVFWEMMKPESRIDPLDTTCSCARCLARFEAETEVRLPPEAKASPAAAAAWLFAGHSDPWIRWRAGLITSWVREVVEGARRIAPGAWVGVHLVPWGEGDYDNGPLRVAGQDVEALGALVDYVSPMCYAHILYREPDWVGRVVRGLAPRVRVPIIPSIEVRESYRSDELTDAFFANALRAALEPPSRGVVFWSWPALAVESSKQEILARRQ